MSATFWLGIVIAIWLGIAIAILWVAAATEIARLQQRLERVEGRLSKLQGMAERIAGSLNQTTPAPPAPLRRVIRLAVWMTRGFMTEIGTTDAEMEALRDQFSADRLEVRRRVEQWTTHTVVFDAQDFEKNIYGYLCTYYGSHETVALALWSHGGAQVEGPIPDLPVYSWFSALVLDDNRIKFCRRALRWQLDRISSPAKEETFICIPPPDEGDLDQYEYGFSEEYNHSHSDPRGFGWAIMVERIAPKG
jgi:hypothetical protein